MTYCEINTNSWKYKSLRNLVGTQISDNTLKSYILMYQEQYGRYPHLREIPFVNSETELNKRLDIKTTGSINHTTAEKLEDYTGETNIRQQTAYINRLHDDLETQLLPYNSFVEVLVNHKPSQFGNIAESIDIDEEVNPAKNKAVITNMLYKLQNLFGIEIQPITTDEIHNSELQNAVINPEYTNSFIYNGVIYVNTDVASLDAPIHEMLHMLLGSLKFDPQYQKTYMQLINIANQLAGTESIKQAYPNRTQNDVNEEIVVTELAKYLTGQPSLIQQLDKATKNDIQYTIYNTLDSLIQGTYSVFSLGDSLYNKSFSTLVKSLNSSIMNNQTKSSLDLASLNRKLANFKEELIVNNKLIENCE